MCLFLFLSGYQSNSQSFVEPVFTNEPNHFRGRLAVHQAGATMCHYWGVRWGCTGTDFLWRYNVWSKWAKFFSNVILFLLCVQGKSEYLGSTVVVPSVQVASDQYVLPTLQYYPLHFGNLSGGDVLAAFELLEVKSYFSKRMAHRM